MKPELGPDGATGQGADRLTRLQQAVVLGHMGRYEAARDMVAELVAAQPDDPIALAALAQFSLSCDDPRRAFDSATASLALDAERAFPWRVRALAAFILCRAASQDMEERRELFEQAVASARRALSIEPENPANHTAFATVVLVTAPQEALAAIHRALELDPADPQAYRLRASVFTEVLPDRELAVEALHELLRLAPDDAGAIHQLGRFAVEDGDLETAATRLRQAGGLNPAGADVVRRDLDWVLAEQQRRSDAPPVEQLPEPLQPQRVSPTVQVSDPALLEELRQCDADRWRNTEPADIERALAELAALRQEQPENAYVLYESALADWLCGRRRAAINRLRKVARLDPTRAGQAEAHIATLEAEDEQAIEARAARREKQTRQQHERQLENDVEHAAEQAIARRERRERAKARRGLGSSASGVDLDAAVRVRRKIRWLVLIPALLLARLALYACASHADDHRSVPSPTTGAPIYQPYEPPRLPEIPPAGK